MRLENAVAADVLERILSAYGFTMQKELSDKLGIAKSNVASWLQRGQVPGNVLVQCALDTGTDINWLVNGEFANANVNMVPSPPINKVHSLKGQLLIRKMLDSGGRKVLQRIMDAYRFKTQKELSEYLGISTGTISTWVRRDHFPGDVVIACALDTNVPLEWLATGHQKTVDRDANDSAILRKNFNSGILENRGYWNSDISFISHDFIEPVFIYNNFGAWLADFGMKEISNGRWLLAIDNKNEIYDVYLLPGKKLKLVANKIEFTCNYDDITVTGRVVLTLEYNI